MICRRRSVCIFSVAALAFLLCLVYLYKNSDNVADEDVIFEAGGGGRRKFSVMGSHRRFSAVSLSNETACKALERRLDLGPKRYVVGLNYWEQTNMAVGSMFALQRMAVDWRAKFVRPFSLNSRLYGLPHLKTDDHWSDYAQCHSLDVFFNMEHMNKVACSYNLPLAASFDDFLHNASRQVTLIHFVHEVEVKEVPVLKAKEGMELKSRLKKEHVFECSEAQPIKDLIGPIFTSLNNEVKSDNQSPFVLSKYYCVNATIHTSPAVLAKLCGIDQWSSSASVMVLNWRGLNNNDIILNSAKGQHRSRRLPISNMSLPWHPTPSTDYFSHSSLVQSSVEHFMKNMSIFPSKFIGIHIRSEKLGIREKRIPNYTTNCLDRALSIRKRLLRQLRSRKDTIIFTDYGQYGSDSCEDCKGARITRNLLSDYKWLALHFNPTQYNVVADSGFVAAVEMDTLAAADSLILVGGGAFQKQLGITFYNQHPGGQNKIHTVCWDDLGKTKHFKGVKSVD